MSGAREVAKRLLLTAVVAAIVVTFAAIVPLLGPAGGTSLSAGPDHAEWSADTVVEDRVASGGQASPSGDVGVVLFDRTHSNRFADEDIAPLVRAVDDAGGEVRFTGITTGFESSLEQADVLVVVDPGVRYSAAHVEAIEEFVDNGGRLLMLGEPNRRSIEVTGFSVQLVTDRSKLSSLGTTFGVSFGTEYLYDMENNDGNFKDVLTGPTEGSGADAVEGVDQVSMYTAAPVRTNQGTVLLRTAPTAESDGDTLERGYPVAVTAANGDVMAVGDKTFVSEQFHTVADNEVFVARMVEFMAGANHQPLDSDDEPDNSSSPTLARPPG
jgi:hypothetical protein